MIFHFGFELPERETKTLDADSSSLTSEEIRILKKQIRSNAAEIDRHILRLELLVNKERYPSGAGFIQQLRRRLDLLMEENDTFRKVLWKHFQKQEMMRLMSRTVSES